MLIEFHSELRQNVLLKFIKVERVKADCRSKFNSIDFHMLNGTLRIVEYDIHDSQLVFKMI